MPRAVITHGYSPAPRGLTVLRCRHRVLAVCASLFLVVAAVATAVIIVSQWQQNSHTAHNVIAQSNTWASYVRASVNKVMPQCSFQVLPSLIANETDSLVVVWETNECEATPVLEWRVASSRDAGTPPQPTGSVVGVVTFSDPDRTVLMAMLPRSEQPVIEYRALMHTSLRARAGGRSTILAASDWYKVANVDRYSGTSRPVTVAVVGDSRLEASALRHQLLHVYRRKPDALIRVGEGVERVDKPQEWHDHVFGPLEVASLGQRVPSVYARPLTDGEQPAAKGSVRGVKPHRSVTWGTYSPQSGYYTVSLASIRLIVLDAGDDSEQQLKFCLRELAFPSSESSWTVVVVSIPPFVEEWQRDEWDKRVQHAQSVLRQRYVPAFEVFGVDLVVSAHPTLYHRGERNGVRYIVVAGSRPRGPTMKVEPVSLQASRNGQPRKRVYNVTRPVRPSYVILRADTCCFVSEARGGDDAVFDRVSHCQCPGPPSFVAEDDDRAHAGEHSSGGALTTEPLSVVDRVALLSPSPR